jgi:serine/threonine-protein kinase
MRCLADLALQVGVGHVAGVTGLTLDQARQTLDAVGLVGLPTGDGAFSDTVPEGSVIRMDIPAGQVVVPGDTIALTVSRGPELVRIPNVENLEVSVAKDILEEMEFVVVVRAQEQVNPPEGNTRTVVTSMDPSAGQQVPKGSTVEIRTEIRAGN